jgi:hypothetical protein
LKKTADPMTGTHGRVPIQKKSSFFIHFQMKLLYSCANIANPFSDGPGTDKIEKEKEGKKGGGGGEEEKKILSN